jgi:hypothetical protein
VIGSEFSYELLHAIHPIGEGNLQQALSRLADAELVYVRGIAPDATYQFKHALIRDAAYKALLKSRRKELHLIVAQTIDKKFPTIKETHPEVLAHHWTEAGEIESAITGWSRAGKAAEYRGADWQKMRVLQRRDFVIGGYTPAGRNFGAILIGYKERRALKYVAKVHGGFNPGDAGGCVQALRWARDKNVPLQEPTRGASRSVGRRADGRGDAEVPLVETAAGRNDRIPGADRRESPEAPGVRGANRKFGTQTPVGPSGRVTRPHGWIGTAHGTDRDARRACLCPSYRFQRSNQRILYQLLNARK